MNQALRSATAKQPSSQLRELFQRNGCVRMPNPERIKALGWNKYKKGYEVRLALRESELEHVRRLLQQAGFKPGKPYRKSRQVIQPVYGKEAVEWFLSRKLK